MPTGHEEKLVHYLTDPETARLAAAIADEERAAAERIAGAFDRAFEVSLAA